MKRIWNSITKENSVFVLLLGLCPALAVTTTFEKSYVMGLCVLFVLLGSNIIISLIRKLVPELVKIPVFILIIGTFVTLVEIILKNELPELYSVLNIYLPLITVNCIIFGRALEVASKESVGKSILDAIGTGLGFTFALMILGFTRELLGSNMITIMSNEGIAKLTGSSLIFKNIFPGMINIDIMVKPAGAFLTLALLLALINFIKIRRKKNATN